MKKTPPFLFLFVLCFVVYAEAYNGFETNPNISAEARSMMRPYLLPEDHPIKATLDKLFRKHVTKSVSSFTKSGFVLRHAQPRSVIRIVGHEDLRGYLIKIQLDDEERQRFDQPVWWWFVKRCEGSAKIAQALQTCDAQYFTVAKEWIYPLPEIKNLPFARCQQIRPVLLVVEDMEVLSREESAKAWKKKITNKYLDELYTILKIAGGSYLIENIPYTKNKTFAFVDAENYDHAPNYKEIEKAISSGNRVYWKKLIQKGDLE